MDAIKALSHDNNLVFTSGVFDVLHLGHIHFFREAKNIVGEKGKLVVAVHADEIVREKKGEDRPYMKLEERIELLSELICIDYVIPWDGWEDISDLALSIQPHYLAVTQKSFEHTRRGKWQGKTWQYVAEELGAVIKEIPVFRNYASSRYSHLFD